MKTSRRAREISTLLTIVLPLVAGCSSLDTGSIDSTSDVRVRNLSVVDAQGNARIVLTCDSKTGTPSVTLLDAGLRPRITLSFNERDHSVIAIVDSNGNNLIALDATESNCTLEVRAPNSGCRLTVKAENGQSVSASLSNSVGEPRITIQASDGGECGMRVFDDHAKTRLFAGKADSPDRDYEFAAESEAGNYRASVGTRLNSQTYIAVSGEDKSAIALMLDESKRPALRLADRSGMSRMAARIDDQGDVQFGLTNGNGKQGLLAECPETGCAKLTIGDSARQARLFFGNLENNNDLVIGVFADETSSRCLLGLTESDRPYLWIRKSSGPSAVISDDSQGRACIELYDTKARRLFLGFDAGGQSRMLTLDKDGAVTWTSK